MLNKIIIAFSVSLLVLVVGEVFYLFFFQASYQPSKTPIYRTNSSLSINQLRSTISSLLSVIYFSKDILTHATSNVSFEGKILELYNSPGTIKLSSDLNYERGIKIEGKNGPNYLLFSKDDVKYIEVYSTRFGIKTKMDFENLRKGDYITSDVTLDLTKSPGNNAQKIVITKL